MSDTLETQQQQERYASLLNTFNKTDVFEHPTQLLYNIIPTFFQETENIWEFFTLMYDKFLDNEEINSAFSVENLYRTAAAPRQVRQDSDEQNVTFMYEWLKELGFKDGDNFLFQESNYPAPISRHLETISTKQNDIDTRLILKGNTIRAAVATIPPTQAPMSDEDIFI